MQMEHLFIQVLNQLWLLIKNSSTADRSWELMDNKRLGYNVDNNQLYPNTNDAETTSDRLDLVSNGFKTRTTSGNINVSGDTYIYMAFAENPFVTGASGIPCTAR